MLYTSEVPIADGSLYNCEIATKHHCNNVCFVSTTGRACLSYKICQRACHAAVHKIVWHSIALHMKPRLFGGMLVQKDANLGDHSIDPFGLQASS
jgi:hypothetical protein